MKEIGIRTQMGMTLYGIMFFILIGGLFATAAIKLGPVYADNSRVQEMLESIQRSYSQKDLGDISNREIIRTIKKHFQVNRIESVPMDSVDIKREKGDVNPKDFIVFPKGDFSVVKTWKDNTGKKEYIEDMAFPTLEFPSDHGLLATILEPTADTSSS